MRTKSTMCHAPIMIGASSHSVDSLGRAFEDMGLPALFTVGPYASPGNEVRVDAQQSARTRGRAGGPAVLTVREVS